MNPTNNCNGPTFCEACGMPGDEKSDRAIFHWTIGVCLGPYPDDPQLCSSDSPEEVSESFDIEPTVLLHRALDIPALTTNETSDDTAR